jgi:hypothetical protein
VASSEGHVWCGRLEAAAALSWHFQPRSEVEIAFKLESTTDFLEIPCSRFDVKKLHEILIIRLICEISGSSIGFRLQCGAPSSFVAAIARPHFPT